MTPRGMGEGNGGEQGERGGAAQVEAAFEERMEQAWSEMDRYVDAAADFVRQRPVASLAAALAAGFLVGKLVSRR